MCILVFMRFLFISHSRQRGAIYNDPSVRYRCVFPAETLNAVGDIADVVHVTQVKHEMLAAADVIIFHRPRISRTFRKIFDLANKFGKVCWADFDDLLFNPALAAFSPPVISGVMSEAAAVQNAQDYWAALSLFENVIVSTTRLRAELVEVFPHVKCVVSFNRVPARWVMQADIRQAAERLQRKIMRYLPGTSHHDGDFAGVAQVLSLFLKQHSDAVLEIAGPLRFELDAPAHQLRRVKYVPYEYLPHLITDSWVCLAPLHENRFNACKSGLKFWESGLFAVPVIASPLPDYARFAGDGLFIASEPDAWLQALNQLSNAENYLLAANAAQSAAGQALADAAAYDFLRGACV